MNKILLTIVLGALILVGAFFVLNNYIYTEKQGESGLQAGYKDIAYTINGQEVLLVNGVAETQAATGSAATIRTEFFGNEVEGDINEDGVSDIAFLLTQNTGGSGTFYYAVAALKTDIGYSGTNAVFLGDRIAPQSTEIKLGRVVVNFAERAEGEPMTATTSVGVTKYLGIVGGELVELDE